MQTSFHLIFGESGSVLHVGYHRQSRTIFIGESGLNDGQRVILKSSWSAALVRRKRWNFNPMNGRQVELAALLWGSGLTNTYSAEKGGGTYKMTVSFRLQTIVLPSRTQISSTSFSVAAKTKRGNHCPRCLDRLNRKLRDGCTTLENFILSRNY